MTFRTQLRPKDLSLEDKLFFTKLPFFKEVDFLMDVGCGPHAHVSREAAKRSNVHHIFPVDPHAITTPEEEATRNLRTWADVVEGCRTQDTSVSRAILFSSVIHDMFSLDGHYGKPNPEQFWVDVAGTGAEYVIVRDMCFQCDPRTMLTVASCHSIMDAMEHTLWLAQRRGLPKKYGDAVVDRVNLATPKGLPTLTSQTLIREYLQFLLQSQWGEDRVLEELREHYFALDARHFDLAAQSVGYTPIHLKHYTMDHFREPGHPTAKVLAMCPEANITTHIQAVYKKDNAAGATGTLH